MPYLSTRLFHLGKEAFGDITRNSPGVSHHSSRLTVLATGTYRNSLLSIWRAARPASLSTLISRFRTLSGSARVRVCGVPRSVSRAAAVKPRASVPARSSGYPAVCTPSPHTVSAPRCDRMLTSSGPLGTGFAQRHG
ncbi:hypothetical protein EVAR_18099_1 [Eumeta japonica]|uniref:Uncharacterized protein n=1 Tax=Eumeta variegata TaxID=151549 RepID=A0A4C1VI05_EUMVA|nr:hypothetical protein EVAR_18099_1 [Eumeta japonica]